MPTRKQRKRIEKERRHEYETVWVDSEGNELEEPPDDDSEPSPREKRADGKKPQPKRPQRAVNTRAAQPPSWRRSIRRSLIMGAVVLVFMYLINGKSSPGSRAATAVELGVLYALLFIPFTYYLDKFAYRRWERKAAEQPRKR